MVATYPRDAVFNVSNFSVTGSAQYNYTDTTTEFILPSAVRSVAEVLPYADGILQDGTTYELSGYNGTNYSNVLFSTPLYASNLTLKTISVPNYFYINKTAIATGLVTYTNTNPVTINGNVYVVDGIRSTFALPMVSNTTNKDSIFLSVSGVNQAQPEFDFPSSTLGYSGVDISFVPQPLHIVELRVFDGGVNKYLRRTSIEDRKVDRGFSYTREPEMRATKYIAGYEKRRLITRRLKRAWTWRYTNINGIEKEAIEQFYLARSGTYEAFSLDLSHLNEQGLATVVFNKPISVTNVLSASPEDLTQNFYNVDIEVREIDD